MFLACVVHVRGRNGERGTESEERRARNPPSFRVVSWMLTCFKLNPTRSSPPTLFDRINSPFSPFHGVKNPRKNLEGWAAVRLHFGLFRGLFVVKGKKAGKCEVLCFPYFPFSLYFFPKLQNLEVSDLEIQIKKRNVNKDRTKKKGDWQTASLLSAQ